MTQQEMIEQNVRMALGDMMLQNIILKARIAELEQEPEETPLRKNGRQKDTEVRVDGQ